MIDEWRIYLTLQFFYNVHYYMILKDIVCRPVEMLGRLVRMSVSGYRGRQFEPRQQYVESLSKALYLHCFSLLRCEMSTMWGLPREGCSVL